MSVYFIIDAICIYPNARKAEKRTRRMTGKGQCSHVQGTGNGSRKDLRRQDELHENRSDKTMHNEK